MNVLVEDLVLYLVGGGIKTSLIMLILIVLRPAGLLYGFNVLLWGLGMVRLPRLVIAAAVGFPMLLGNLDRVTALIEDGRLLVLAAVGLIELLIGLGIGLMASLPFAAVIYAGAITDQFRGESDSGIHAPTGGTVTTFGLLYLVIAIMAFVGAGGFMVMIGWLYSSYVVWPLGVTAPAFTADALALVMGAFTDCLRLAIRVAMPLLIVFVMIELSVSVGARLAQRFGFYNMSFMFKNLAAILSLPVVGYYMWLLDTDIVNDMMNAFDLGGILP